MLYGLDAAYPVVDPQRIRALGWSFVCGYLGGNTPHSWSPTEWANHRDAGLKLLPIWVAPYGEPTYDAGVTAGNDALAAMQAMRLSGMLALDVENGATPREYAEGFTSACHAGSCAVTLYGSRSTIVAIGDLPDAWWSADWVQSGVALGLAPLDWSMLQYATGPQYDYNIARDDFQFAELGV